MIYEHDSQIRWFICLIVVILMVVIVVFVCAVVKNTHRKTLIGEEIDWSPQGVCQN